MNHMKLNLKNTAKLAQISAALIVFNVSFISYSQDLFENVDLQDSPLSLSLTTTTSMTTDNQTQQLVIGQYGIFNKVTVNQAANSTNTIKVHQDGVENSVNISQIGFDNRIDIEQYGHHNLAEVNHHGNGNIANIRQEGEQSFIVHQIGNEMVVNITQY